MRHALLVPVRLLKSKSLLHIRCCWALPPLPGPTGSYHAVNMLTGGLGDPEQERALPLSFPAAKSQLASPGRGRLCPAHRPPSQLSTAVSDGRRWAAHCRTPLHGQRVGSPEQHTGRQSAPHFLWHSCRRLSCAALGAWHKPIQFMFASKWWCEITEASARNWENQLPSLKFRNESFCSWTPAIRR